MLRNVTAYTEIDGEFPFQIEFESDAGSHLAITISAAERLEAALGQPVDPNKITVFVR